MFSLFLTSLGLQFQKKQLIGLCIIFGMPSIFYSQNCKVRVTVVYEETNKPASHANIRLTNLSTNAKTQLLTDESGVIEIDNLLVKEKYSLSASLKLEDGGRYLSKPSIYACFGAESITKMTLFLKRLQSASSPKPAPAKNSGLGSNKAHDIDDILESSGGGGSSTAVHNSSAKSTLKKMPAQGSQPSKYIPSSATVKARGGASMTELEKTVTEIKSGSSNIEDPSLNEDGKDVTKLVDGRFAYDVPNEMKVGNSYQATVSISKSMADEVLFHNLDSSKYKSETIKLTSKVKVALIDPSNNSNFSIQSLNTEEQYVDINSNTVWRWNIKPLTSGNNSFNSQSHGKTHF